MKPESTHVVFFKFALLATTFLCYQATVRAIDHSPGLDSSYKRLLDVWLKARVETLNIPGVAIAIIHDQNVIYRGCFGDSDIASHTPVTPKTIFRIASQSKLFTAIAIMHLRNEGLLNLDDAIEKHLDWVHINYADGRSAQITIRQLLTHTSGLSSITLHSTPLWSNFKFPTVRDLQNEMNAQVLLFSPGEKLKYSNLGYALLGQVVKSVSGRSFSDYIEQKLFIPLGLKSTLVSVQPDANMLATGYAPIRNGKYEKLPFIDVKAMASAIGMSSSLDDLARFVRWQFQQLSSDESDVIAGSTLREMQRPHRTSPKWDFGQGFGFWVIPGEDRTLIGHEGQNPGFFSTTMIKPEGKIGVVLLSNGMEMEVYSGKPNSLMDAIFNTVETALADVGDTENSVDPDWYRFYGEYRSIWGRLQVMALRGELMAFDLDGAEPLSRLYRLKAIESGSNRFRAVESQDHFYLREEFTFRDFQDGKAMTLRDPGADFRRVTVK